MRSNHAKYSIEDSVNRIDQIITAGTETMRNETPSLPSVN